MWTGHIDAQSKKTTIVNQKVSVSLCVQIRNTTTEPGG